MMLTIKNDYHFIIMKNSVKLKAVKIFYTFVYVFTVLEMNKKKVMEPYEISYNRCNRK